MNVRTNVSSINAQRNIFGNNMQLSKSMEKLSSGFRINRAGDDAAGLAISEKLKAQIGGVNQAARNALDGVSMIQTAEAGLDEVQSMMNRIRDLAVQGANDTLGSTERAAINTEVQALFAEINNVAARTKFNGQVLLNGNLVTTVTGASEMQATQTLATGVNATYAVDLTGAKAGAVFTFSTSGTNILLSETVGGVATRSQNITNIAAIAASASATQLNGQTLNFDQLGVRINISNQSTTTAKSIANIVTDLTTTTNDTLTTSASVNSATLQTGAYAGETTAVSFVDTRVQSTGDANMVAFNTAISTFNSTQNQANASALITGAENALNYISSQRAVLGASQNRLEHTIANLKAASENLSASNSRIRDVDVAEESANLSRYQILVQAATAMLAQANQMPQLALKLLQ